MVLETERLILRRWRPSDRQPFIDLNSDPRVMEYFPATLTPDETESLIARIEARFAQQGFGFWAAELKQARTFIGFIGLNIPGYPLPFSPCTEIGWRLSFDHWKKGYAQEGARAVLTHGFKNLGLEEIVAFTAASNVRSRRVMEAIGMAHDPQGDFDHPDILANHPLRKHVLYRKTKDK
jgi:ribosomal-protein-alanine N-acetyltransferase/3-dehydroquinate dehydratase/shikimate dehydrogenase